MYKKTLLVNQNGDEFIGWSDNEFNPTTGELIFNTAMTGFVEILSDPSYINQIITFTSSHVGNYGMSQDDYESNEPKIEAAIGNSFTYDPSSWRSEKSVTSWLKEYEIPFSGGFDVRSITKHLRDCGSSMFAIGQEIDKDSLINLVYENQDVICGLSKKDIKTYVRYLADRRLLQLGLKPQFKQKDNPLPWLDWIVNGDSFKNFFEGVVTDYNASGMTGDWGWE